MSKDSQGILHAVTDRTTAATHPEFEEQTLLVGPSTANEHNTLRARVIPKACFKVEDSNFEFDSSFITILTFDVGPLKDLLDKHPGSKLSIFGHTDPVGRDDYNKTLSGRRAQAVYGLLVRDVKLWEDLYYHHDTFSGKDEWGVRSVQLMLNRVGPTKTGSITGELDAQTRQALSAFEDDQGVTRKGFDAKKEIAPETFRNLASNYMDAICIDDELQDFRLKPEDFLARGLGRDGKGDYQGCGEFNPLTIFSKEEKTAFEKSENHARRNKENQPNRRVMILLFRPGSLVDPNKWPCPSAKDGIASCIRRFYSDGEKRRSNQAERREFQVAQDTFACRFYDRLVKGSPCEQRRELELSHISILLRSNSGALPLADFGYKIRINPSLTLEGKTDKDGLIQHRDIPTGNYPLELNGAVTDTLVPTLPLHIERCPLRVPDLALFENVESPLPDSVERDEVVVHAFKDDESLWELADGG